MKKTTKNIIISFLSKYIPCSCIIYTLAITSASALPSKENSYNTKNTLDTKIDFFLLSKNLEIEEAVVETKDTTFVVDFEQMKPKNKLKQIKEQYLTLYSDKKETLKATYLQGAYAINYTQSW